MRSTGDLLWHFWGAPGPGEFGNDTWDGDSWQEGGAAPWIHPAVDPELNLVYFTFGNVRAGSSQNGSTRGGDNLFANSIVALDLNTGAYKWHFQSIHHDIWDMDNVMSPVLVDAKIRGRDRKLVVYGSKSGMYYILDRRDGSAPLGIDEVPVPQEPRQKTSPTQPFPRQGGWTENCVVDQPLGTAVPGNPNRAVPNYERGCLYAAHWDVPILSIPGHGGGADWNHQSFSQSTGLMYTGFGYVAAAHSLTESSNGLRPPGEYQTGGIVAVDPRTNRVRWKKRMPYSLAHGNGILTTATDLLFIGQPDGNLLALDARDGDELWRFQTGAAISASPISYEIDGEQYIAIYAGGTGIPYGNSAPRGDNLWAFKIGGNAAARCDSAAARGAPAGLGCAGRRQRGQQHHLARSHVQRRDQHPRRDGIDRRQRHGADASARADRHDRDVHQPSQQRQHALRDAVLRRAVQFPSRARPVRDAHVQPARRVLLQRLLQPATHRQGRGHH